MLQNNFSQKFTIRKHRPASGPRRDLPSLLTIKEAVFPMGRRFPTGWELDTDKLGCFL
jgi:hypothetical protein